MVVTAPIEELSSAVGALRRALGGPGRAGKAATRLDYGRALAYLWVVVSSSIPGGGALERTSDLRGIRPRILLVDDLRANLLALEAALEPLGHDLVSVTSGAAALAQLEEGEFAVVLLDVQMPGMDGFQVSLAMHQISSRRERRVPVILVTANDIDKASLLSAYKQGAVDIIQKPLDTYELRAKVSIFVELFRSNARVTLERATANGRLQGLSDLGVGLSGARTRSQVAEVIIQQGMALARADICTLHQLAAGGRALELVGARGIAADVLRHIATITANTPSPALCAAFKTGTAVWAESAAEYHAMFPDLAKAHTPERRPRAFWGVPLVVEGRAIGLLGMGFYDERPFPPEERGFIETFTKQCAQSLERSVLLEREEGTRRWLTTTLRSIGDAVLATDTEAKITFMNPVAETLTGWSEAEARGLPLDRVFQLLDRGTSGSIESPVVTVLRDDTVVTLTGDVRLRAKNGTEIPVANRSAPIRDEGGQLLGAVLAFRDVTQERLESARQEFLSAAGEALVSSLDYRATLATVARLAVPRLADWCAVEVLEPGQLAAEQLAVAHVDPAKVDLARSLRERYPPDPTASTGVHEVIRTGRPLLYASIPPETLQARARDAEHLRLIRELKLESAMVVPLSAHGRTFGALTFVYADSGRRYAEADLAFAVDFARRAAMAIENALALKVTQQSREAEEKARHRVARMQEITAALSQARTLQEVAHAACEIGSRATSASSGAVWLLNDEGDLALVGRSGPPESLVDRFRLIPRSSTGVPALEVVRTGEPAWVETEEDYARRSPELHKLAKAAAHIHAYSATPLALDGTVDGVLVFSHPIGHRFDEDERTFHITLAHHCSQALHRARLFDAERQANERLHILASAGEVLARSLDIDETLQAVARLVVPAFTDWCTVDLVEDDVLRRLATVHSDVARASAADTAARAQPRRLTDPGGIARVIADRTPRFFPRLPAEKVESAAHDAANLAVLEEAKLVSAIVVPLLTEEGCVGAMSFTTAESERVFTEKDLRFAEEIARRAGVAIGNARLYRAAQEAARRAEEANRVKDEFLATVSHELRTPLNAINGWSVILTGRADDAATVAKGVAVIRRNAQAQAKLIEDILDVSRIVTGKLRIDTAETDLCGIIRSALDVVGPAADAKQVRLTFDSGASSTCLIVADGPRLQQVLWNLLSNAIKFTPPLGVVRLHLEQESSEVRVTVTDTGVGMEPGFLQHVFERFRQADGSTSRSHGGLGLGLALVRHIVELHGGKVSAESAGLGHGSTFRVVLPVRTLSAPVVPIPRSSATSRDSWRAPSSVLRGVRILVADDDADGADLVAAILSNEGASVELTSSVREALAALDRFGPDVVVSDVGMPGEDGYALIRQLRSRTERGKTPAVALTAFARTEDRSRLLAAGFDGYLAKPVDAADLVRTIERVRRRE